MFFPSKAQFKTLGWIYFAYVMCYLVRKNYPMILPTLKDVGLLTQNQAGIVASVFEVVVAVVKFFCGTYVDGAASPSMLLVKCLAVAGVTCMIMQFVFWTFTDDSQGLIRLSLVTILWSANGAGQAVAWPVLARVFMAWFPDAASRGTWYSILATNQNLGGVLAPLIYPPLMAIYGWEIALFGPALLTLIYTGMMSLFLQSRPPSNSSTGAKSASTVAATATTTYTHSSNKKKVEENPGFLETFKFLLNMKPFVWLCIAYIPIMLIRQSLINWTAVIFNESGMTLFEAGSCISSLEFGGFIGGLTGGYLSDQLFKGRRGPVMVLFSLLCVPLALALQFGLTVESAGVMGMSKVTLLQVVFFFTGFASFPPHSLIGLMSREISPVNMRSTAGCVAKASGQFGAAAAGWPLQFLAQQAGWSCVGYTNAVAGILAAMAFVPLWDLSARDVNQKIKR